MLRAWSLGDVLDDLMSCLEQLVGGHHTDRVRRCEHRNTHGRCHQDVLWPAHTLCYWHAKQAAKAADQAWRVLDLDPFADAILDERMGQPVTDRERRLAEVQSERRAAVGQPNARMRRRGKP